ncbi:MAG: HPF/RaiA family ribosome-associated protein [Bacteroidetes bacterium]|nr:HPF/RaiA family ribosome-associated protein [Bacteroidota bacterium]
MNIQFNTDHNVSGKEEHVTSLTEFITKGLSRFEERITNVEVHLTDENGSKNTPNDKRCVIEVRLNGLPPIAVTNHDNTHEQVVRGAVDKMKSALDSAIGRLRDK